MTSPARRHLMKVKAAKNNPAQKVGGEDKHLLAALYEHKKSLSAIQSIKGKIKFKEEILPTYEPYVLGALKADTGAEDRILSTLMVWYFDVGDTGSGLDVAEYILKHGLSAPDDFKRTPATIVAENVAEHWLNKRQIEKEIAEGLGQLVKADELVADVDMPDEARAKLHKALGFVNLDNNRNKEALGFFKSAFELDSKSGVKTEISKLEKLLSGE